jgi:hypothetical protein
MSIGYTVFPSNRTRKPNVNLTSPIHRIFSVPRSLSATMPRDCERNDRVLVLPCVTLTRSSGVRRPLTMQSAAVLGSPVPVRFHDDFSQGFRCVGFSRQSVDAFVRKPIA